MRPFIEYPLDYTFKIMGRAADDFPEHARRLVARVVAEVPAERIVVRQSRHGKYHSVSVVCTLRGVNSASLAMKATSPG